METGAITKTAARAPAASSTIAELDTDLPNPFFLFIYSLR